MQNMLYNTFVFYFIFKKVIYGAFLGKLFNVLSRCFCSSRYEDTKLSL